MTWNTRAAFFALALVLSGQLFAVNPASEKGDVLFRRTEEFPIFPFEKLIELEHTGLYWFCDQFVAPKTSWVIHAPADALSGVYPFERPVASSTDFLPGGNTHYIGAYTQPFPYTQFRNEVIYQAIVHTLNEPYSHVFWRHVPGIGGAASPFYAHTGIPRMATNFIDNPAKSSKPYQEFSKIAPWGVWTPDWCEFMGGGFWEFVAFFEETKEAIDTTLTPVADAINKGRDAVNQAKSNLDKVPWLSDVDRDNIEAQLDSVSDRIDLATTPQQVLDLLKEAEGYVDLFIDFCQTQFPLLWSFSHSIRDDGVTEIAYQLAGRPFDLPWDTDFGVFVQGNDTYTVPLYNLALGTAEEIVEGRGQYTPLWLFDYGLFYASDDDTKKFLHDLNPLELGSRPDWRESLPIRERLYSAAFAPWAGSQITLSIKFDDDNVINVPNIQTGLVPEVATGPAIIPSVSQPPCQTCGQVVNVNAVISDGPFGSGVSPTDGVGDPIHLPPASALPSVGGTTVYPCGRVEFWNGDPDLATSSMIGPVQVSGIPAPNNPAFYTNPLIDMPAFFLNNFPGIISALNNAAIYENSYFRFLTWADGGGVKNLLKQSVDALKGTGKALKQLILDWDWDGSVATSKVTVGIYTRLIDDFNTNFALLKGLPNQRIVAYMKDGNPQIYSQSVTVPCGFSGVYEVWVKAVDQACNESKVKLLSFDFNNCVVPTPNTTPGANPACTYGTSIIPDDITGITSAVACDADGDTFFAVTNNGQILSFQGSPDFSGVDVVVQQWGGTQPAMAALGSACKCPAAPGISGTRSWAVGNNYTVIFNDGASLGAWATVPKTGGPGGLPNLGIPFIGDSANLRALDVLDDCSGKVWVAGEHGVILEKQPGFPNPQDGWILSDGPSADAPFRLNHFTGITHASVPPPAACNPDSLVVAVGYRDGGSGNVIGMVRYTVDGGLSWRDWTFASAVGKLNGIGDIGNGELYAVGDDGTLVHIVPVYGPTVAPIACGIGVVDIDVEVVPIGLTNLDLLSITSVSATNIILGGENGKVVIWNGIQWTTYDTHQNNDFKALYSKSGFNYAICSCGIKVALPCNNPVCDPSDPACIPFTCLSNCSGAGGTPNVTPITLTISPTFTVSPTPASGTPLTRSPTDSPTPGSPTETPTSTNTSTSTLSSTPQTRTPSVSATVTMTPTATPTATPSSSPSITMTVSSIMSASPTRTPASPTETRTFTITVTPNGGGGGGGGGGSHTPIAGSITPSQTPIIGCVVQYNAMCCTCCDDNESAKINWLVGTCMTVTRQGGTSVPPSSPAGVQGSDPSISLNAVACFSPDEIWTVGDQGTALHTADGGQSWDLILGGGTVASPSSVAPWTGTAPRLISVDTASDGDTVTIADDLGGLYISFDRGVTWGSIVPVCPVGLSCANSLTKIKLANPALTNNETWVLGDNGAIYWGVSAVPGSAPILTMIDPATFPAGGIPASVTSEWPPNTTSSQPVGTSAYTRERWQQVTFNDIYVVRENHFLSTGANCMSTTTDNVNCGEVWVVGDHGVVLRGLEGPGGAWNWTREAKAAKVPVPPPQRFFMQATTERLVAVDWAAPDKISIVGDGLTLHWDGVEWIRTNVFHFKPVAICRDYVCINDPPRVVAIDSLEPDLTVPSLTPTETSTPSATPTGTPSCSIRVQYVTERFDNSVGQIGFRMAVVNNGAGPLELGQVRARYWLTADGSGAFDAPVWWAGISPQNSVLPAGSVLVQVLPVAQGGQSQALEVSFDPALGALAPGQKIEWTMGLSQATGNQLQLDDYSFSLATSGLVDWPKVTGYCGGQLTWGLEPADPTATSTQTSTKTPSYSATVTPSWTNTAAPTWTITVSPSPTATITVSPSSTDTPSPTPSTCCAAYNSLSLGSSGSGPGQFQLAYGVGIDGLGYVYVSDPNAGRVQKFTMTGSYLFDIGSHGSGVGQYESPRGIHADRAGSILIADYGNSKVLRFSESGTFLGEWGTTGSAAGQFTSVFDVATDGAGNVFTAEGSFDRRIQKFNSAGTYLASWSLPSGASPRSLSVNQFGEVFVGSYPGNKVYKYDSSGGLLLSFGAVGSGVGQLSGNRLGVATDSSGDVWVVDSGNSKVLHFDRDGTFICEYGSFGAADGQFVTPEQIDFDTSGSFFVSDSGFYRVEKFISCSAISTPTMTASYTPTPSKTPTACPPIAGPGWPMIGGDPQQTGHSTAVGPSTPDIRWTGQSGWAAPVVGLDGTVYSGRGVIFAYDPYGSLLWQSAALPVGSKTSDSVLLMDGSGWDLSANGLSRFDLATGAHSTLVDNLVAPSSSGSGLIGLNHQLYFADPMRVLDSAGNVLWDKGLAGVSEITVASNGDVFRVSQSSINGYDSAGSVLFNLPTSNSGGSVSMLPGGGFVVAERASSSAVIRTFDRYGNPGWTFTDNAGYLGSWHVGVDSAGAVYFLINQTSGTSGMVLTKLTATGELGWRSMINANAPQGWHSLWPVNRRMVIDGLNRIYVPLDTGVTAVDASGAVLWSLPGKGTAGLALSHDGTLYVSNGSSLDAIGGDPCTGAVPSSGSGGAMSGARVIGKPKGIAVPKSSSIFTAPNPGKNVLIGIFDLGEAGPVQLVVYDLAGHPVLRRDFGQLSPARHSETLDVRELASGLYLVVLLQDRGAGYKEVARSKAALIK